MNTYSVRLSGGSIELVEGVQKVRAVDGTLCFHAPEDYSTFIYGPLVRGYSLTHVISWERLPEPEVPA